MGEEFHHSLFTFMGTNLWVDVLVKAFSLAAKEQPDLRLLLLGNGSQASIIRTLNRKGGRHFRKKCSLAGKFLRRIYQITINHQTFILVHHIVMGHPFL